MGLISDIGSLAPEPERPATRNTTRTNTYGLRIPGVAPSNNNSRLDVPRYLQARGIEYRIKDVNGGTAYCLTCPFDSNHGANGESAVFQADTGVVTFECKHDSCQGRRWADFKDAVGKPDPDHYDPPLHSRPMTGQQQPQIRPPDEPREPSTISPPVPLPDIVSTYPQLRPPIIDGLLRAGETMNLVAAPKAGKSWLGNGLALSLAAGLNWLDMFPCQTCRVLVIDGELHPEMIAKRLPTVAASMGLDDTCLHAIDVWCLRGVGADLVSLSEHLRQTPPGKYGLIILDAWYRFLPGGTNESDNANVTTLYNIIDGCASRLESAWINIHHASKGDQSGKTTTDVGSGAGSQSRAADTHLVIRPHEQPDTAVVHAVVRSWPPISPFCIQWRFPVWTLAEDANPTLLQRPMTAKDAAQQSKDAEGFAKLTAAMASKKVLTKRELRPQTGMSRARIDRLLDIMAAEGQVEYRQTTRLGNACHEYWLSPVEDSDSFEDQETPSSLGW